MSGGAAPQADSGQSLTKLAVDGGMTANGLLMQLQADLLGISVNRARMTEATAFGCAPRDKNAVELVRSTRNRLAYSY